jgi:nitrogenase subunit NifH
VITNFYLCIAIFEALGDNQGLYLVFRSIAMEPFTLAGIATLVLVGIFNKMGETVVEESVEQFKRRLSQKSPETVQQLQTVSESDTESLMQPIQTIATLIEEDATFRQLAEMVASRNVDKQAQAVKIIKNVGFIAEAGSTVSVHQNFV